MRWRPLLLACCLATALPACGRGAGLAVDIDFSRHPLTGSEILQFVVLHRTDRKGAQVSCLDLQATCIRDQSRLRIVRLNVDGRQRPAYRVPLDLTAAQSPEGQAITIPGIPPGRNYLLALEVVASDAAGEQRTGIACTPLEAVVAGDNPPLEAPLVVEETTSPCNPALE